MASLTFINDRENCFLRSDWRLSGAAVSTVRLRRGSAQRGTRHRSVGLRRERPAWCILALHLRLHRASRCPGQRAGWEPVSASEQRVRPASRVGFQMHELRFARRIKVDWPWFEIGDVRPEMILQNAHDGTRAYRIDAGLCRLVCRNGLWWLMRLSRMVFGCGYCEPDFAHCEHCNRAKLSPELSPDSEICACSGRFRRNSPMQYFGGFSLVRSLQATPAYSSQHYMFDLRKRCSTN